MGDKNPVMLAKELELGKSIKNDDSLYSTPPNGWKAAEKFDGYRCLFKYIDSENGPQGVFYSRNNKIFNVPEYFLQSMPPPNLLQDKILDGELWAGRNRFQLMGTVRKKIPNAKSTHRITDI